MRVVLDTNILISALWKPDGLEAQVVRLAREGEILPCVSEALWAEYHDVLSRDKFLKLREAAGNLLFELALRVTYVHPKTRITVSKDDEDNRVLECAGEARAEYLITGNLRHFPGKWECTKIVNARAFLAL